MGFAPSCVQVASVPVPPMVVTAPETDTAAVVVYPPAV
jgi:hypothetical protein